MTEITASPVSFWDRPLGHWFTTCISFSVVFGIQETKHLSVMKTKADNQTTLRQSCFCKMAEAPGELMSDVALSFYGNYDFSYIVISHEQSFPHWLLWLVVCFCLHHWEMFCLLDVPKACLKSSQGWLLFQSCFTESLHKSAVSQGPQCLMRCSTMQHAWASCHRQMVRS